MKQGQSDLSYMNQRLDQIHTYWQEKITQNEIIPPTNSKNIILFMSIGNETIRAKVFRSAASTLNKAMNYLRDKAIQYVRKYHLHPRWIKVDFVTSMQALSFSELEDKIAHTRRNYFRSGIAFDEDFRLAFLEQEINGNVMIRSINKNPLQLDERNINRYLNKTDSQTLPFMKKRFAHQKVYTFQTEAIFMDRVNPHIVELYNGALTNGIRKTKNIKTEIQSLIRETSHFLQDQVMDDGKFEYGYFSAFAKRIPTYNILRHSSTLYAMVEGYEMIQDDSLLKIIEKGIDYAIREALVYQDENDSDSPAFMVDYANKQEIKLGANATAILAMTKYMQVTNTTTYLKEAQALAKGILEMKTFSGGFIHVLEYPGFHIKDLQRIIYYEGEAVFALLRLYALDSREEWLQEARNSLDYFIENDYWEHHDHWLSYASNEIIDYLPEDRYFEFGLKNCNDHLQFIYHRDTTYPTFLELTMAAYKLVQKMKKMGKTYLLEHIDEKLLNETVDHRAEYQRVGYFYPEVAMYMKNPSLVLHGFFVRHHAFRVRIDDIEHYLSGYCQYVQHRLPHLSQQVTLENL